MAPSGFADGFVDGAAVAHQVVVRHDETLQRRVDVVEEDVCDEPIDPGIDARRVLAVDVARRRNDPREHAQVCEPACHRVVRLVTADALEVVALRIVVPRAQEGRLGQPRMLAQHRVAKGRPVAVVLPARERHDPAEVVEQARDQQVLIALRLGELGVERQAMLADEMGEDGFAVADDLPVVDDVGKLAARGMRGVDDVLVTKGNSGEPEEGVDLQAVTIVVGDAEEPGVRVQRQHRSRAKADSPSRSNEHAHAVPGVSRRAVVTRPLPAGAITATAIAAILRAYVQKWWFEVAWFFEGVTRPRLPARRRFVTRSLAHERDRCGGERLSSITAMSPCARPERSKARAVAGIAERIRSVGAQAPAAMVWILASGASPRRAASARDMSRHTAAPSACPEDVKPR